MTNVNSSKTMNLNTLKSSSLARGPCPAILPHVWELLKLSGASLKVIINLNLSPLSAKQNADGSLLCYCSDKRRQDKTNDARSPSIAAIEAIHTQHTISEKRPKGTTSQHVRNKVKSSTTVKD